MRTVAVLLAAGRSERFGSDKLWANLEGSPLWTKAYRTLESHPLIEGVGIVARADQLAEMRQLAPEAIFVVSGGETRTRSASIGFEACPAGVEAVLFHDAARPYLRQSLVTEIVRAVEAYGAAFPGLPITDTVKQGSDGEYRTLDRATLVSVQTPQGARVEHLRRAFDSGQEATDDMALLEAVGVHTHAVRGDSANIKVTTEEDLRTTETRTGIGYDVHRFDSDPARPLWLGGVEFEGPGLQGHSDADALIHAVVDALLGAAGLGDIGEHFPDSDQRWKGERSATFLKETAKLLATEGWDVVNIDVSVIAERPRLAKRRDEIRSVVAGLAGVSPGRVSIKATTNEGLGAIGRGEGVAAFAVATVKRAV